MKFIACICLITAITTKCLSQTKPNDPRGEYGSWILTLYSDRIDDHFAPKNKFPPTALSAGNSAKMALNAARQKALVDLMNVFKELYPKPHLESMLFRLDANLPDYKTPTPYLSFSTSPKGEKFQYDNLGKVKKLNYGSQVGGVYNDGYMNINVNYSISKDIGKLSRFSGFFELAGRLSFKNSNTDDMNEYDPKPKRKHGLLYYLPAKNNFDVAANFQKIKVKPTYELANATTTMNYWRHFEPTYPNNGYYSAKMHNLVIMGYNGQMPYSPITRGEYLELWEECLQEGLVALDERLKNRVAEGLKNNKDFLKSADYTYWEKDISSQKKASNFLIEQCKKIKKNNETQLNKPTYFLPTKYISKDKNDIPLYTNLSAEYATKALNEIFTDDVNAATVVRPNPNYYKGMKPDEIRCIMVEWFDGEIVLGGKFNKDPELFNANKPYDNSNETYHDPLRNGKRVVDYCLPRALTYRMDWKKLEALLAK
jgi:hypothetical protein